jgi:hypothetical protein
MPSCIYTKEPFQTSDGEHILQNFLGARWISSEIVSNEVQAAFGRTIDAELEKGMRSIRTWLGTLGGRGGEGAPLKNIQGSSGNRYHITSGGKPTLAEPILKGHSLPDGTHQIQGQLGDIKQLGWFVAKLKDMHPNSHWNTEQIKPLLFARTRYTRERFTLSSHFGGDNFFRGALKSAFNLLGTQDVTLALNPALDGVRNFILTGSGKRTDFLKWMPTKEEISLPRIGEFDHFLTVYSRNNAIEGYVQYFGELGFLLKLSDNYDGHDFAYSYIVDPFRDGQPSEQRMANFEKENIPSFSEGRELPDDCARSVILERFARLMKRQEDRQRKGNISRIVDETLLPHIGENLSQETLDELARKIAEFFIFQMLPPADGDEADGWPLSPTLQQSTGPS